MSLTNNRLSTGGPSIKETSTTVAPLDKITLERIIGCTSLTNACFAVHPITGDIVYATGATAVLYNPKKNKQIRYYKNRQTITCLNFSNDGEYLAIGQKGRKPTIQIWSTNTGILKSEIGGDGTVSSTDSTGSSTTTSNGVGAVSGTSSNSSSSSSSSSTVSSSSPLTNGTGAHSYGIACLAFTPNNRLLISIGYKNDRGLHIWDWKSGGAKKVATGKLSQKVFSLTIHQDGTQFVTAGEKHLKFWSLEPLAALAYTNPDPSKHTNGNLLSNTTTVLTSKPAILSVAGPDFETFVDVGFSKSRNVTTTQTVNKHVYALTAAGMLCVFDENRLQAQWVHMRVKHAFALDVTRDSIFISCSDGIVRVFTPGTLAFRGTLPLPPAIGRSHVTVADNIPQPSTNDIYPAGIALRACSDEKYVSVIYGDRSIFIWDITNLDRVLKYRSMLGHAGPVWGIQTFPNVRSSASSAAQLQNNDNNNNPLLLPSSPTATLVNENSAKEGSLSTAAYPSGSFVTCGMDCTVRVWNLNNRASLTRKEWLVMKQKSNGPNISANNDVSLDNNGEDVDEDDHAPGMGRPSTAFTAGIDSANSMSSFPRNIYMKEQLDILYVDENSTVINSALTETVFTAGSWPTKQIVTVPFDIENGTPSTATDIGLRTLAIHPLGHHIATGDRQGLVRIFDIQQQGKCISSIPAHDAEITSIAYSHTNGRLLASASRDRLVHIFDTQLPSSSSSATVGENDDSKNKDATVTMKAGYGVITTLADHSSAVTSVLFTRDDTQIVTAGVDNAIVFSKVIREQPPSIGSVQATSQSSIESIGITRSRLVTAPYGAILDMDVDITNKNLITAGADKRLHVWSLRNGKLVRSYKGDKEISTVSKGGNATNVNTSNSNGGSTNESDLNRVVLDPSGLFVAAASLDRMVRLIDFYSGSCIAKVSGHAEPITGITFLSDGRRLITVSSDSTIFIWKLAPSLTKAMMERLREIEMARISTANVPPTVNAIAPPVPPANNLSSLAIEDNITKITTVPSVTNSSVVNSTHIHPPIARGRSVSGSSIVVPSTSKLNTVSSTTTAVTDARARSRSRSVTQVEESTNLSNGLPILPTIPAHRSRSRSRGESIDPPPLPVNLPKTDVENTHVSEEAPLSTNDLSSSVVPANPSSAVQPTVVTIALDSNDSVSTLSSSSSALSASTLELTNALRSVSAVDVPVPSSVSSVDHANDLELRNSILPAWAQTLRPPIEESISIENTNPFTTVAQEPVVTLLSPPPPSSTNNKVPSPMTTKASPPSLPAVITGVSNNGTISLNSTANTNGNGMLRSNSRWAQVTNNNNNDSNIGNVGPIIQITLDNVTQDSKKSTLKPLPLDLDIDGEVEHDADVDLDTDTLNDDHNHNVLPQPNEGGEILTRESFSVSHGPGLSEMLHQAMKTPGRTTANTPKPTLAHTLSVRSLTKPSGVKTPLPSTFSATVKPPNSSTSHTTTSKVPVKPVVSSPTGPSSPRSHRNSRMITSTGSPNKGSNSSSSSSSNNAGTLPASSSTRKTTITSPSSSSSPIRELHDRNENANVQTEIVGFAPPRETSIAPPVSAPVTLTNEEEATTNESLVDKKEDLSIVANENENISSANVTSLSLDTSLLSDFIPVLQHLNNASTNATVTVENDTNVKKHALSDGPSSPVKPTITPTVSSPNASFVSSPSKSTPLRRTRSSASTGNAWKTPSSSNKSRTMTNRNNDDTTSPGLRSPAAIAEAFEMERLLDSARKQAAKENAAAAKLFNVVNSSVSLSTVPTTTTESSNTPNSTPTVPKSITVLTTPDIVPLLPASPLVATPLPTSNNLSSGNPLNQPSKVLPQPIERYYQALNTLANAMNTVATLYDELQMSILQDAVPATSSNNNNVLFTPSSVSLLNDTTVAAASSSASTTNTSTTDSLILDAQHTSIYPAQGLGTSIATLGPQASTTTTFLNTTNNSVPNLVSVTTSLSTTLQNLGNFLPFQTSTTNRDSGSTIDVTSLSSISNLTFSPSRTIGSAVPIVPNTNPVALLQLLRTALLDVSTSVTNALTVNPVPSTSTVVPSTTDTNMTSPVSSSTLPDTVEKETTNTTTVIETRPDITIETVEPILTEISPQINNDSQQLSSPSSAHPTVETTTEMTSNLLPAQPLPPKDSLLSNNTEYSDDFTVHSSSHGASLSLSSTVPGLPSSLNSPPTTTVSSMNIQVLLPPPPPTTTGAPNNGTIFPLSLTNLPPPPPLPILSNLLPPPPPPPTTAPPPGQPRIISVRSKSNSSSNTSSSSTSTTTLMVPPALIPILPAAEGKVVQRIIAPTPEANHRSSNSSIDIPEEIITDGPPQ